MAEYQQKPNTGTLFKNNEKRSENSPDYNGILNIEGTDYYISGWIKTAGSLAKNPGSKFLSLSVQLSRTQQQSPPSVPRQTNLDDYDDDVLF